jgi:hypothetical protein
VVRQGVEPLQGEGRIGVGEAGGAEEGDVAGGVGVGEADPPEERRFGGPGADEGEGEERGAGGGWVATGGDPVGQGAGEVGLGGADERVGAAPGDAGGADQGRVGCRQLLGPGEGPQVAVASTRPGWKRAQRRASVTAAEATLMLWPTMAATIPSKTEPAA